MKVLNAANCRKCRKSAFFETKICGFPNKKLNCCYKSRKSYRQIPKIPDKRLYRTNTNSNEMKMKTLLTAIFVLFSVALQAQIPVSEESDCKKLSIAQVLTGRNDNGKDKYTVKLFAEETSVQFHNGEEAYKTVRETEYEIKFKGNKISRKRKVLSSNTENICPKEEAEPVFPDVTFQLLTSVLHPKNIRKDAGHKLLCFTATRNDDGTTTVFIDKLACAESEGTKTHVQEPGADLTFEKLTEELTYNSQEDNLHPDALKRIVSVVSLISKEESGTANEVKVREEIVIKSVTKK